MGVNIKVISLLKLFEPIKFLFQPIYSVHPLPKIVDSNFHFIKLP